MNAVSILDHLHRYRSDKLKKLARARKSHHGQRLAQRDAVKATNAALRAFVRARKAQKKPAATARAAGDLFGLE